MPLAFANPTVGESMRPFDLSTTTGKNVNPGSQPGKISILAFYGIETASGSKALLLGLRDAHPQFASRAVSVVGIGISAADKQKAFSDEHQIPYPIACDAKLETSCLYGALLPDDKSSATSADSAEPARLNLKARRRTVLFGPDRRIVKIYDEPDPATHAAQLLSDIDALLLREPPRRIVTHAPVLLIPNVMPVEVCKDLIQLWHQDNGDSGFMKQVDGKTVGMYDYAHKIRRDHFMKPSPELDKVKGYIKSRVIPAIHTAFNFEASRFEDFRIAGYDSSRGGYFRPHRDNTTEGTAHRRFAMSLLLNDDYEGGFLRFPEYGLDEYRPQAGGAIIFSCSLLHEATDVTAGQRFVLLSFLYGEKEAKMREQYSLKTGGEYRAVQEQ